MPQPNGGEKPSERLKKPQRETASSRPLPIRPGDVGWALKAPQAGQQAIEAPPNMVIGPDWRAVLNDNFSSSNVDMNRWWTRYVYNDGTLDYLNDEWQRYREDGNHVCVDGVLHLTALPHNGEFWPSGMLRSKDCFPISDGNAWYFESRMKVPNFLGAWSAFWIAGSERVAGDDQSVPWPPEIDQMEIVNNGTDDTTHMLHCSGKVNDWNNNPQGLIGTWAADGFNWEWMYYWSDADLSAAFHTYGLYYKGPKAIVYLDRKPILAMDYSWVADDRQPMPGCYLLANLAVGGSWAGRNGVDNEALPRSLEIDYIRAYVQMPQSTIGHNLLPT